MNLTSAENEAQASQAMLAQILSIAADAIITVDEAQRILHFNLGAERIFGWTAVEVAGRSLDVLLPKRVRGESPTRPASVPRGPTGTHIWA